MNENTSSEKYSAIAVLSLIGTYEINIFLIVTDNQKFLSFCRFISIICMYKLTELMQIFSLLLNLEKQALD